MESNFNIPPETRAKIEEMIREFKEKKDYPAVKELSIDDLEKVAAGGPFDRPELDPNMELNGISYTDLHTLLCWVYESYHNPAEKYDVAKDLTIDVAYSYIPSVFWKEFKQYPYPAFIEEAMWRIWCPVGGYK